MALVTIQRSPSSSNSISGSSVSRKLFVFHNLKIFRLRENLIVQWFQQRFFLEENPMFGQTFLCPLVFVSTHFGTEIKSKIMEFE